MKDIVKNQESLAKKNNSKVEINPLLSLEKDIKNEYEFDSISEIDSTP